MTIEAFVASRDQVVASARRKLQTPFAHQGRMPGLALDCAGLLVCVCWELGIKPRSFDVRGYPVVPDGDALKKYCDEHMTRIPERAMQAGDAVLVRWADGEPQHLGIVADHLFYEDHLSMIHAIGPRKPAKVIETRLLFGRFMRFVAAYQIPGVG